MSERPDRFDKAARLEARTHEIGFRFLLTEIQAGLTMLDAAETGRVDGARERRLALAHEAYDVVAERLARTGHGAPMLTDDERRQLTEAHAVLGHRLGR